MKYIKRDIEHIVNKNISFFERTNSKKPLLGIYVMGLNYMKAYKETSKTIPINRPLEPEDINISSLIRDIEDFVIMHEELGDDIFYSIQPFLYIPWMEAIAGCPIYVGSNSFYAKPFLKNLYEFDENDDLLENNKWFMKLLEIKKALIDYFSDNYPVSSSTHLRGPADLTSAALGQEQFCIDFYDNPEELKKIIDFYTDLFIKVAKIENEISSKSKFSGYVVNTFGIWTSKICQFFQDDALAFISPKLFKDFFLNSHLKIDAGFNSTFYHLHPVSMFMVDELIKYPNLKIIEINREPETIGPDMEKLVAAFRKIQDNQKSIYIHFTDISFNFALLEKELNIIKNNLSTNGMCVNICVGDLGDGLKKMDLMRKVFE